MSNGMLYYANIVKDNPNNLEIGTKILITTGVTVVSNPSSNNRMLFAT